MRWVTRNKKKSLKSKILLTFNCVFVSSWLVPVIGNVSKGGGRRNWEVRDFINLIISYVKLPVALPHFIFKMVGNGQLRKKLSKNSLWVSSTILVSMGENQLKWYWTKLHSKITLWNTKMASFWKLWRELYACFSGKCCVCFEKVFQNFKFKLNIQVQLSIAFLLHWTLKLLARFTPCFDAFFKPFRYRLTLKSARNDLFANEDLLSTKQI